MHVSIFSWEGFIFAPIIAAEAAKTGFADMFSFIAFESVESDRLVAAAAVLTLAIAPLLIVLQKGVLRGLSLGVAKG